MQTILISRSDKPDKKFMAKLVAQGSRQGSRTTHFGQRGASDFRVHRDEERKQRYLKRHAPNQNWSKSGAMTAGFLSRHLLWNEESLEKSVARLNRKYSDLRFRLR
jgi:hypothetical protein